MSKDITDNQYVEILRQAVAEIKTTRVNIARQVNSEITSVYWNIGKLLYEQNLKDGYGSGVVKRLSIDLKEHFPDMGLSPRNLWDMKRFYERYYQVEAKLRQAVAVLPWGHNLLLLNKLNDDSATAFYAQQCLDKGWSRDLLLNAIKMNSYAACAKEVKTNNFDLVLPELQAMLIQEINSPSTQLDDQP